MKKKELVEMWEYLHQHPEVSWDEHGTTNYLMNHFKQAGFHPVAFESIPGFYVDVGTGKPKVGLRADMDGLLQEVNGILQANHSCGHDAHMTIVTGVMHRLKEIEKKLNGSVRAIFQPAEEVGNGAVKVVEMGIVDELVYLFGVHVRPKNEIPYPKCAPGIQHGSCAFVKGKIKGDDHHGARPNEGINAIEVGSSIMQHLKHLHTKPQVPTSVKITQFHAGGDHLNIIPGSATFGFDLRAQTNEVMNEIKEKLASIITYVSALYEVEITYKIKDHIPAAIISTEAEAKVEQAIKEILGRDLLQPRIITSGSDDFHYFTLMRPQIKATMLALGADVLPGLHHPNMRFNTQAIENGVNILLQSCLLALES
ncbi:amidohydrolase [Alkalihalophilus pseudofirmus]|uniref:Amidohydrolase n=1 Tax=Alkalihalophilus pseudofirmus TaxID=79885 RepID=A0AAJ2NMI6_ALKPS|nr:amidohydrolase [Alkalihalophilus pseudofirmus]MDV2883655.1 amidohydrolase [Alkalihalophilus pseudofirmus]